MDMKTCGRCRQEKPADEFYPATKRGKPTLSGYCKPCGVERRVQWGRENPEKRRAIAKRSNAKRKAEKIASGEIVAERARLNAGEKRRRAALRQRVKDGDPAAIEKWERRNALFRSYYSREQQLLKKYGLSTEAFEALLALQEGCCASCRTTAPGQKGWHVDHDHSTGRVRGILCHRCNLALGLLGDALESVRDRSANLIAYLSTVPERMAAAGLSSLEPPKPRTFRPSPVVVTEEPADLHAGLWC